MNDLEKLITDLSNYWDLSPEKVVDRLNHMNESEIKNVVSKMTKKFEKGGLLPKAKFENGGIIKCLKGGKTYAECKKCEGKTLKAEDGEKVRRTDRPGNAWTHADGIDVLTQDAVGPQPLPGSYSSIEGSTPEWETWRTTLTNKGGNVMGYNYDFYLNDGDHIFSPVNKYTTKRMWNRPSTWLRRELTPERAAEMKAAYDANKLAEGGIVKAQNGIELTKSQSYYLDPYSETRGDWRKKYREAKQNLREQGMSGKDLRLEARRQTAEMPIRLENAAKVAANVQNVMQQKITSAAITPVLNVSLPFVEKSKIVGPITNPVDVLKKGPVSLFSPEEMDAKRSALKSDVVDAQIANAKTFSEAFGIARKAGLTQFDWKGKPIAVVLDEEKTKLTKTPETKTKDTQENKSEVKVESTNISQPSSPQVQQETVIPGNSALYTAFQKGQLLTEPVLYTPPTQFDENGIYQFGATYTKPHEKTITVEDMVAAAGVNPNSPQGKRMARLYKHSDVK